MMLFFTFFILQVDDSLVSTSNTGSCAFFFIFLLATFLPMGQISLTNFFSWCVFTGWSCWGSRGCSGSWVYRSQSMPLPHLSSYPQSFRRCIYILIAKGLPFRLVLQQYPPMNEAKRFIHHNSIKIQGVLHNAFFVRTTWVHQVNLRHTSAPLGHKWSCTVPMGIANLSVLFASPLGACWLKAQATLFQNPTYF